MKRSTPAAAAVVLLMLTTGCASAGSVIDAVGPSSSVHLATAGPVSSRAVALTYRQKGGEEGLDKRYRFTVRKPPPAGFSRLEVNAALEDASDPSLRSLEMPPLPEDQCCDFYLYVVTITWADGTSRTYKAFSGGEQPPAFDRLLDRLP